MKRASLQGMTLLEVLVALGVFSIAALAILYSTGQQVRVLSALQQKTFASWVAENQLIQVRLEQPWPELGWHAGQSELAGAVWYWRWRGVQTTHDRLRAIEVEVRAQPEAEVVLSALRTYVTQP